MADPLAIWGAATGTAGLGLALRREIWANRRRMSVERGWQYFFAHAEETDGEERSPPSLLDVWVYVMAWNTGRRPLHIEYAGFEFIVPATPKVADQARLEALTEDGIDLAPEGRVWMSQRVEIALNSETFEVVPDGPSVKLWTRIQPLLALGIDPTATEVRPFVVTVPEKYEWGSAGPLLPRPPVGYDPSFVESELARLAVEHEADTPGRPPLSPGQVLGVPRLIPEGDVEHARDVLPVGAVDERQDEHQ